MSHRAKVLLVDTNFSSGPIYNELINMGHEVHVIGRNSSDYLAKKAPHYWPIDYSKIEYLRALIESENFDFVVPGCNDKSYDACVQLSPRYKAGFDSANTNLTLNNKKLFKQWAQPKGFPVAKVQQQESDGLRWPLIVKPVDAFSGRGVTRLGIDEKDCLDAAIAKARQASSSQQYLIEDYVDGQLYSHSAFIRNHQVFQDFIVREDSTVNPFVVDTSHVVSMLPGHLWLKIRKCIEEISRSLNLVDGLIHTQLIVHGEDFWLIELTRRCPGDLYSQLIELATGFPYARMYVLPFLGERLEITESEGVNRPIMRHTVTAPKAMGFDSLKFHKDIKIEKWVPLTVAGDQIYPAPDSRICLLFCSAKDSKELEDLYGVTLARQLYKIIE